MRDDISRVRQYELMAIFSPEIPEEELQGAIDRVSEIITGTGSTVSLINRESPWGRRRLSYPIRYNSRDVRDGIYVLYYADIDTQQVTEIERDLKLTTTLMRYLITQQVAEQMIPESMKPDDDSLPGAAEAAAAESAATETAPADAAADVEAAPTEEAAPAAEAPAAESSEEAAPAAEAPAAETVEEAAPAADAPATETAEETAAETTEDADKS